MPPTQKSLQRRFDELRLYLTPRFLAGLALIISSIFAALLIRTSAERSTTVWSASQSLAPGAIVRESDIAPIQIRFSRGSSYYLSSKSSIAGSTVVRQILAGELIPASALSTESNQNLRRLALSFPMSSLPYQLRTGQLVDLYLLPREDPSRVPSDKGDLSSSLLISSVGIEGIESSAREIGGNSTITFLIPEPLVTRILSATIDHRLIIIKR